MRLHSLAAATTLTLALSACVSSGGLQPQGSLTAADTLQARRSLAELTRRLRHGPPRTGGQSLGIPN